MPPFEILLLSGGEPFLRDDLADILALFCRHNDIGVVGIPTNGLLPARIEDSVRRIMARCPSLSVGVNLSLDAVGALHDRMRGVPGSFRQVEESLRRLSAVRRAYPGRLQINMNTVICAENYHQVPDLAQYALEHYALDGHYFELVRGDPQDRSVLDIAPEALRQVYARIFPIQLHYFHARPHSPLPLRWWRRMTFGGSLLYQYRIQYGNYVSGRRWDVPCLAGQTIAVVDYDGGMRACELHPPVANLRDHDMDFRAIYTSGAMEAERRQAHSHKCDCTHVCFITSSRMHSSRVRFILAPWLYLRYMLSRRVV